jgi:hypothetical protein
MNGDIGFSRESSDVSMKIAVMAPGGVGGYFGARLAAGGEDVRRNRPASPRRWFGLFRSDLA